MECIYYYLNIFSNWNRADGGLAPKEGGSEDGITGGPKTPQQIAAHRRLQQTQAQVDEVLETIEGNWFIFLSYNWIFCFVW